MSEPAVAPEARAALDRLAAAAVEPWGGDTIEAYREAARRLTAAAMVAVPALPVEAALCPGPGGPLPLRIYRPPGASRPPAVVFLHGGGFVRGDLDTHDPLCRMLAHAAGALVVAVDYRRAPEHRFPAALEDAFAATAWVARNAAALGAGERLVVAGDSAGANLATGVARLARDRGGPRVDAQLLLYPGLDAAPCQPSAATYGEGFLLDRRAMRWMIEQYAPGVRRDDPLLSPLRARDLVGLPPALIVTAELDPLRDEGELFGRRLRAAGVPARVERQPAMPHNFLLLGALYPGASEASEAVFARCAAALRALIGGDDD